MQKAKEIYFQYCGSQFQMMRDGVIEEYRQYKVSENLEEEWLKELIEYNINSLDVNNEKSLFPLSYIIAYHSKYNYIDKIIEFINVNKNKVINKQSLILFIGKVEDIIDKMENNYNSLNVLSINYKNAINLIKNKYT